MIDTTHPDSPKDRQYKDVSGNPCSLSWLVRNEPEWAVNQIRHRDRIECELNAAKAKITEMQKLLVECSNTLGGLASSKVCEAAHHDVADQHWLGDKCPVEIRFCKIYESVSEFLEKNKPANVEGEMP